MTDQTAAEASTTVSLDPANAFRVFTEDIGIWWQTGTNYWNDAERGLRLELEPGVGGRFREVYDETDEDSFEIGTVTAWEPGIKLSITWRQLGWDPGVVTEVDILFEPIDTGTRVTVRHFGWERVPGSREGYGAGWTELLGLFAQSAEAAR
jgi:Activator of Hsp90 ATPase homolog 1-like protein